MRSVFLLVAALLVSLVVAEIALRAVAPEWLEYRMAVLNAGHGSQEGDYAEGTDRDWPVEERDGAFYRFKPDSSFPVTHYEYSHVATTDRLGARSTLERQAGLDVVFMGDSFTFGVGVKDLETFVALLEKDVGFNASNLGVPGSTLTQQVRIARMRHEELGAPRRYVFVMFLGNDIADLWRNRKKQASADSQDDGAVHPVEAERQNALLREINDWVFHNVVLKKSYFLQLVKSAILQMRAGGERSIYMDDIFRLMRDDGQYLERSKRLLSEEFQKLVDFSATGDAEVLILLIPDKYQVDSAVRDARSEYYGLDSDALDPLRPNMLVKDAADASGLEVVDPFDCIRERSAGQEALYYKQDGHFTPGGHAVFAACAAPRIRSWLDRTASRDRAS